MIDYGVLSLVPPLLTISVALYSNNMLFLFVAGIM